ncbi:hypothetical protein QQ045_011432 [Rhodiola kirilowii]
MLRLRDADSRTEPIAGLSAAKERAHRGVKRGKGPSPLRGKAQQRTEPIVGLSVAKDCYLKDRYDWTVKPILYYEILTVLFRYLYNILKSALFLDLCSIFDVSVPLFV